MNRAWDDEHFGFLMCYLGSDDFLFVLSRLRKGEGIVIFRCPGIVYDPHEVLLVY